MSFSEIFIRRPAATTLLTMGVALGGALAFFLLPVAPLPQVDFPTIEVTAQLPGASPETVATSVATPLERHLGQIADVTEMTSTSAVGQTRITLQFGLERDINGAARDVQAAINAARADLPAALRSNPTYKKFNPSDSPVMILALTSNTLTPGQLYDSAATVLQQKLSQLDGIGEVTIGGSSLPAVRVEINPKALFHYQIGLEDVRAALNAANAHSPKGIIEDGTHRWQIYTNDQSRQASDYKSLIIAYRNGAAVRLSDVADVVDSVENLRNGGLSGGKPAVLLILYRQPGANIIDTVDGIYRVLPQLKASIPADIDITPVLDRTTTIRASLHDVERTLVIAILLVVGVVFAFLRNPRSALVPSVAVPVSLLGTMGVMYLLGYSLDNLSLMALTVATGFVVDDAIVVLENISRHIEAGMPRFQAALLGAREVSFTVVSMSLSLVAVFIPILLMGGIIGRYFREFAMTLSIAIAISLVISLTTTPMMCAYLIRHDGNAEHGRVYRWSERAFDRLLEIYDHSLKWSLRHSRLTMLILMGVLLLNIHLFAVVPKGFFPQQDNGMLFGGIQADQSISFQRMRKKMIQFISIIQHDPDIQTVTGFTGGRGQTNSGFVFITLKPLSERKLSADQVIGRLRRKLSVVAGARLFLQSGQDIRVGGRAANAQYQYTLQGDDLNELYAWAPKIAEALQHEPVLTDVNSDQQQNGLETDLVIDRDTAARLGVTTSQIDNTLYDAFGQRLVSTIYAAMNQYHVVMEVAPQYWQSPETLRELYVSAVGGSVSGTAATNATIGTVTSAGTKATAAQITTNAARNLVANQIGATGHGAGAASTGAAVSTAPERLVPLAAFSHYGPGTTPLAINHQGPFVATTISFNLAPGKSLSDAEAAVDRVMNELNVPVSIHGSFQGTARVFQESIANEPILITAALLAVYIVLGVLYESYVHPITILSTLPSAGLGALLALMALNTEFSIIALIGVILLIGIVKKNAIMMIDYALLVERSQHLPPQEAIYQACLRRFRPIMMTTLAAMFGALPLALGIGEGSELRQPLGISIVGGLIVSQVLTLYTTPVIYLYLDRFRLWSRGRWRQRHPEFAIGDGTAEPGE
ncbi:MAG TPA: efflux RND transporter permease subunit [Stellaceae bacterium]|nr:efflux RND transporter permease subunit [Stellaceae bacterium]